MKKTLAIVILASSAASAAELRVLTFNVAGIPFVHPKVAARMEAIAPGLGAYDVVAVQEAWWDRDVETLRRGSGLPHLLRVPAPRAPSSGLALLSRWPVLEAHALTFAFRPSPLRFLQGEWFAEKGALFARVGTPGGRLDVYATHFIAAYPGAPYRALRLAQMFELAEFVDAHSGQRPMLLLGDLNCGTGDEEYELLTALLGVRDLCRADGKELCAERRIDHVLVPAGDAGKSRAFLAYEKPVPGAEPLPYSDHAAIEARLDARLLKLPRRPDPETRRQALRQVERELAALSAALDARRAALSWIPVYGAFMAAHYDRLSAQLNGLRERAGSALARAARA